MQAATGYCCWMPGHSQFAQNPSVKQKDNEMLMLIIKRTNQTRTGTHPESETSGKRKLAGVFIALTTDAARSFFNWPDERQEKRDKKQHTGSGSSTWSFSNICSSTGSGNWFNIKLQNWGKKAVYVAWRLQFGNLKLASRWEQQQDARFISEEWPH